MTKISLDIDKVADLEKEYKDLCREFLEFKNDLLESFVNGAAGYKQCSYCGSLINGKEASIWYRWHRAECLICHGSMLSMDNRKKLASLANKRENAHRAWQGLSKKKEPLYKDVFFEMRHISKTSKPPLEKKTTWQKLKGIFS